MRVASVGKVAVLITAVAAFVTVSAGVALGAGSGSIDHVESDNANERVLFSIPGLPNGVTPDLSSVVARIDGSVVKASATSGSASLGQVDRVSVLALDVSTTMQGKPLAEAKQAALAFLAQAPSDVKVGLVTFAETVQTVVKPTTNRKRLTAEISSLQTARGTHLYEGIKVALVQAHSNGQRRVLVLSDGRRDTTGSALSTLTRAVQRSHVRVDVVLLGASRRDRSHMSRVAAAGQGTIVRTADPSSLTAVFADEARELAGQILVSFPVPAPEAGQDVTLTVSLAAGGTTYSDDAFVSLGTGSAGPQVSRTTSGPVAIALPKFQVSNRLLLASIATLGLMAMMGLAAMFGVFRGKEEMTLERRLGGYQDNNRRVEPKAGDAGGSLKASATAFAQKAIRSGDREARLSSKLDSAGLSLKPAEWVLAHAGVAVLAALLGFLLSSGKILVTLVLFMAGVLGPWAYLGIKRARRIRTFNSQLGDTLQLISGALTAGLSLSQSIDTIMREGVEPIAGEFRRALVEAQLGIDIDDALDGVAERMESKDFGWVVMAVRIQRDVGGNLAELLLTVATTLREREFLRRQVRSLSAEGRLSALILCGLPPAFILYLALTRGDYLSPMFHTGLGWMMVAMAVVLMSIGTFWMSRVVKVEI
jgi:tight adherence protein B